uniref:Uncharacterized protein n=1 Tax=Anguilla anguilla TaxID=7936 RepID=A0A0E9SCS0_ANGAN
MYFVDYSRWMHGGVHFSVTQMPILV